MLRFILGLLCVVTLSFGGGSGWGGANAQPAATCAAELQWATTAAELKNAGLAIVELEGEDKVVFLKNYNAIPPVSTLQPQHVWIATKANARTVLIFFEDSGCITLGDQTYHTTFLRLLVR